jgi:uncharacterized membrane protein
VTLPVDYATASIILRVIGTRQPPLHDKAVVSKWTTLIVNSAAGSLGLFDVGSVGDVSDVHFASIFRIKMRRVGEFLYVCVMIRMKPGEEEWGLVPCAGQ